MAASSLAGSAPLPPSSSSNNLPLSPQLPGPPPPTSKGRKSPTVQIISEGEHKKPLTPTKSQWSPDFLPPEMLQTLKQQQQLMRAGNTALEEAAHGQGRANTSSLRLHQRDNEGGLLPSVHPPANMWSYPRRRSRFAHLTAHPPCVCGAGRDISFLYDVPEDHDNSGESEIPHTLIPEEYHIHKRVGVVGLEFHQDQYTTQSHAHDTHVTVFPSMKPGGRYEVMALKGTLDAMLAKAGVPCEDNLDLDGHTQVHNLLELVRKEQVIYNICFHEIIRQVSVQCVERGELLQEIRSRYAQLLDRIPRQVMSLHTDLVSQRALCRRLATEVKMFKAKMASITERLSELRDVDTQVVEDTQLAYKELSSALTESEKNANLLKEYHKLYELQRKRLQASVDKLRRERDLWQGAAYGLAGQVTERLQVRTLRRLQLGEMTWSKLARHFATLLANTDTQQLREVNECVGEWREGVMSESGRLEEVERDVRSKLSEVEDGMKSWCKKLKNVVVVPLDQEGTQQLWEGLKAWFGVLNSVSEVFSGEALLSRMESLKSLNQLVERWTQAALDIFTRHQEINCYDHAPSDHAHSPEHQTMVSLGSDIDMAMKYCTTRASGDNGVAVGLIHLITALETWDAKLNLCLTGDKKIPDSDWIKLCTLLGEWVEQLQRIIGYIGTVTSDNGQPLQCTPMSELSVAAEKWRSALYHSVTARDAKIDDMVTDMHLSLVLWMVQLLLTSTNTRPVQLGSGGGEGRGEDRDSKVTVRGNGDSEVTGGGDGDSEVLGGEDRGTTVEPVSEQELWDRGMGLTPLITVELKEEYESLANSLKQFTSSLTRSVGVVVERGVEGKRREENIDSEEEKVLLEQLGKEAWQWAEQAALLMTDVMSGLEMKKKAGGRESEADRRDDLPEEVFVMGADLNIRPKPLQELIDETPRPVPPTLSELGLLSEQDMPEGGGYDPRDTEALVLQLDDTRSKLEDQEKLTKQERERAETAERQLESSRAHISVVEVELQQLRDELEESRKLQLTKSKGGGRGGGGGRRGRGGGRPSSRK